jgi:hypothetical protein
MPLRNALLFRIFAYHKCNLNLDKLKPQMEHKPSPFFVPNKKLWSSIFPEWLLDKKIFRRQAYKISMESASIGDSNFRDLDTQPILPSANSIHPVLS